jgi:hypothetical protein
MDKVLIETEDGEFLVAKRDEELTRMAQRDVPTAVVYTQKSFHHTLAEALRSEFGATRRPSEDTR